MGTLTSCASYNLSDSACVTTTTTTRATTTTTVGTVASQTPTSSPNVAFTTAPTDLYASSRFFTPR